MWKGFLLPGGICTCPLVSSLKWVLFSRYTYSHHKGPKEHIFTLQNSLTGRPPLIQRTNLRWSSYNFSKDKVVRDLRSVTRLLQTLALCEYETGRTKETDLTGEVSRDNFKWSRRFPGKVYDGRDGSKRSKGVYLEVSWDVKKIWSMK